MNVVPTKGIIVLKSPEKLDKNVTAGGIHLPQNVKQPNTDKVGIVCATGKDVNCVKVGDIVIVDPRNLVVAVINDEVHIFAKEENIVAILDNKEADDDLS